MMSRRGDTIKNQKGFVMGFFVVLLVLSVGLSIFPKPALARSYEFGNSTAVRVNFDEESENETAEFVVEEAATHGAQEVLKYFGLATAAKLLGPVSAFISMIPVVGIPTSTQVLATPQGGGSLKGKIRISSHERLLPVVFYKTGDYDIIDSGLDLIVQKKEGNWPFESWEQVLLYPLIGDKEAKEARLGFADYVIIPKRGIGLDPGTYKIRARFGKGYPSETDPGTVIVK